MAGEDLKEFITLKINEVNSNISDFRKYVGSQLQEIKTRLESTESQLNSNCEILSQYTEEIKTLKNLCNISSKEVEVLKHQLADMKEKLDPPSIKHEINDIKKKLDNEVNRGMRKTLIFRGIPESENETWDETTNSLVSFLLTMDNTLQRKEVENDIERDHRGGKNQSDGKPRLVFAKFHSWKRSEFFKSTVVNDKTRSKRDRVYGDQMYSPEVTERRNKALKHRKSLIDSGSKGKMFVKYPAILMVKEPGDIRYKKLKEF